jgi:3-deoxy-D-manno-octulosonate 8-phosphate phosphatase (KDO 8-P phosphatase)
MDPSQKNKAFLNVGNVLAHFRHIHTFIFDVDGVLTNGQLLITEEGKMLRRMNVRDGYAMKKALDEGYNLVILTSGKSEGVFDRLRALGIEDIISHSKNKLSEYEKYLDAHPELDEDGILYLGDDIPDLEVMRRVGLPCCPSDGAPEIRAVSHYVSTFKGGEGCVRDVIEKVLKLNGLWV